MNIQRFLILISCFFLLAVPGLEVQAQQLSDTTILRSVNLVNRKDSVLIKWSLISDRNVLRYSIFHRDPKAPTAWQIIDSTQNSIQDTLVFKFPPAAIDSESFRVRADSTINIHYALGNIHTLNFLRVTSDTCKYLFHLKWTGYKGWGDSLTYLVIVKEGSRRERIIDTLRFDTYSIDFLTPQSDTLYLFDIKAVKSDGLVSFSNQDTVSMPIPKVPSFINADFATINSRGNIALSFSLDPASGLKTYVLLMSETETGAFSPIQTFSNVLADTLSYIDNQADPLVRHFYKLGVQNTCNIILDSSNVAGNIVLSVSQKGSEVSLNWNQYTSWTSGGGTYSLMRSTPGGGWEFVAAIPVSITSYTDVIDTLAYRNYSDKICYFIKATGDSLSRSGTRSVSNSNVVCAELPPAVKIPNAFTPNGDLVNDEFTIRFDFIPAEYLLKIFDRNGNLLFQTSNPSDFWKGTDGWGKSVIQGTYVYYLRYSIQGQRSRELKGTISVLYP